MWLLHVLDLFSHISRLVGRTFVRGFIVCNARSNALSRAGAWHRINLEKAAATKLRNVDTSLVFYYPDYAASMCDDGLTHRPIIDGNQKKRCPTRINSKRLAPCLHANFFFFLNFCSGIFIRVRASVSQVGKYYNDSLTVKILMTRPVDARRLVTTRTPGWPEIFWWRSIIVSRSQKLVHRSSYCMHV